MRKITRQACEAFIARKNFQSGNTSTDGRSLYLHGNRIASRLNGNSDIFLISDAGWRTPTTRERLNGLIDCLAEQGFKVRPRISFAQNSTDLTSGIFERATLN
jgi:hypothetical protein